MFLLKADLREPVNVTKRLESTENKNSKNDGNVADTPLAIHFEDVDGEEDADYDEFKKIEIQK
jgi:hypothetical protein